MSTRKRTALLTIEFVFEFPPNPFSSAKTVPITLITNKNDWTQPIRQLISSALKNSGKAKGNEALLDWLGLEEDDSVPSSVLCVMKKPKDISHPTDAKCSRPSYYKLDWNSKLSVALRNKHFVEFPTLLLVDEAKLNQ